MTSDNPPRNPPQVKPWVRRTVKAAGVVLPETPDGEKRLGWWGVEMARFLRFCKGLPAGTELKAAMEGYGRSLKGSEPPLKEWQIDQAREALRCLQKGIENWEITAPDADGNVEVRFRVKTRGEGTAADQQRSAKEGAGMMPGADVGPETCVGKNGDLLEASARQMRVRRFALRTVETYLGWQGRFLRWTEARSLEPASRAAVEGFITWLAVERKVSAATQNQALSSLFFPYSHALNQPLGMLGEIERARRPRKAPVVLTRRERWLKLVGVGMNFSNSLKASLRGRLGLIAATPLAFPRISQATQPG